MVFCIGEERCEKLSNYISRIVNAIKNDNRITAVAMNSYIIHLPLYSYNSYPNIIDGLNIRLTLICDDKIKFNNSIVESIKSQVLNELNYNITLEIISSSFLKENKERLKYFLTDSDILFDHKGDLTFIKNSFFYCDKSNDAVIYQPRLNIRS